MLQQAARTDALLPNSMPLALLAPLLLTAAAAAAQPPQQPPPSLHVTWAAPFLSGGGYCSEALALTQALSAASPATALAFVQHGDSESAAYYAGLPAATADFLNAHLHAPLAPAGAAAVSVCHSEPGAWHLPPAMPRLYFTPECPEPTAHYTIGRTMFETDRLPAGWAERLRAVDEVWVPSAFMRGVVVAGGVEAARVRLLAEPVDAAGAFSPASGAASAKVHALLPARAASCAPPALGRSADCPFRFLSVGKWERRKGFDVLLAAYVSAFAAGAAPPFVELYILTSSYHGPSDFRKEIDRLLGGELACPPGANSSSAAARGGLCLTPAQAAAAPPIRLLTSLPQTALPGVYASIDAVVQPSRGEGWGRPHVEGMAMGKPLLATFWSGSTEFMTPANSFPLAHGAELQPIPSGAFAGHLQAEPSGPALVQLLRQVAGDGGAEGARRGAQARADMLAKYSHEAVGRDLARLLKAAQAIAEERRAAQAAQAAAEEARGEEL